MDIFIGYAGLVIAWVIMMSILLMIFIKADNISWKLKFITIPLVLWFSVALYNIPGNFMGWPTEKWAVQNEVIILSVKVDEGKAIYFWVVDYNIQNVRVLIDPRNAIMPYIDDTPRAYKVKYNSKVHEALVEARRRLATLGRGALTMRRDRLEGFSKFDGKKPLFELLDPADVLRKDPEQ